MKSLWRTVKRYFIPAYQWVSGLTWRAETVLFLVGIPLVILSRLDQDKLAGPMHDMHTRISAEHGASAEALLQAAAARVPSSRALLDEDASEGSQGAHMHHSGDIADMDDDPEASEFDLAHHGGDDE